MEIFYEVPCFILFGNAHMMTLSPFRLLWRPCNCTCALSGTLGVWCVPFGRRGGGLGEEAPGTRPRGGRQGEVHVSKACGDG